MNEQEAVHPGRALQSRLKKLGLTTTQVAEATKVDRSHLSHIIAGRRSVSAEIASKLAHALSTTPEYWMELQQKYDLSVYRQKKAVELEKIKPLVKYNRRASS